MYESVKYHYHYDVHHYEGAAAHNSQINHKTWAEYNSSVQCFFSARWSELFVSASQSDRLNLSVNGNANSRKGIQETQISDTISLS